MSKLSSLSLSSKFIRLGEGSLISTRIMASAPYTKLNDNSFVADCGVDM